MERDTPLKELARNLRVAYRAPRWRWALLIAASSDILVIGVALFPPAQLLLDGATALALFAILGFRWPLLPALAVEVVPGLELFPVWTLVVLSLAATETLRGPPPGHTSRQRSGQ